MKRGRPWTDEERERFRCLWNSDVESPKIAELLDRTVLAVTSQASWLRARGEPLEWRRPAGRVHR